MKGGTYAQALKAGFPEKQAIFFAHMSMETKQEAVDYLDEKRRQREVDLREIRRKAQDDLCRKAFWTFVLFVSGTCAGVAMSAAGWLK